VLRTMKPNGKTTVLAAVGIEEWRSLTNADISRRVGVARPNVSAYRRRHGLPNSPHHQADVSSVLAGVTSEEWRSLSNREIAHSKGVSRVSAWAYREIHGLPKPPHTVRNPSVAERVLAGVPPDDWRSLNDAEIARRNSVSLWAVWRYRKKHGIRKRPMASIAGQPALPRVKTKQRHPRSNAENRTGAQSVLAAVKLDDWRSLNDAEIGRRKGVSTTAVWAYRIKHGLPKRPRSVLAAVGIEDWRSLNDYEIAHRIGQSVHSVWAFRKKHGLPRSPGRRVDVSAPATVEIEEWRSWSNYEI
jgi:hypothetical protein